jgi:hypothetical protein
MSKPETMMIDDVKYIREDSIKQVDNVTIDGAKSIASQRLAGKFVIVRSRNEGVNAGTVVCADETGIELANCRRLYYHKPADKSLSWYEGVAQVGLGKGSKVSGTTDTKLIIEDYSATICTDVAATSIMEWTPNAQG